MISFYGVERFLLDTVIRSTGHAFVTFESSAEATQAVAATDKKSVFGNVLDVQLDDALPRVSAGSSRSYNRKYGKIRIRNVSTDRYGCREDLKNLFRRYGSVRGADTAFLLLLTQSQRFNVSHTIVISQSLALSLPS